MGIVKALALQTGEAEGWTKFGPKHRSTQTRSTWRAKQNAAFKRNILTLAQLETQGLPVYPAYPSAWKLGWLGAAQSKIEVCARLPGPANILQRGNLPGFQDGL